MRKRRLQALCSIFVLVAPLAAGAPPALAVDEPTPSVTPTVTATPSPDGRVTASRRAGPIPAP